MLCRTCRVTHFIQGAIREWGREIVEGEGPPEGNNRVGDKEQ